MKKLLVLFIFLVLAGTAFAQKDPFAPHNPITMGRGNAFVADASGYNAFFYNPAGFARKSEFTLLSFNVYGVMDRVLFNLLADAYNQKAGSIKGLSSKGAQSRDGGGGTDPSNFITADQQAALIGAGTDVADYLSQAESTQAGSVSTAINQLAADPAYSGILNSIDPNNPPTSVEALLPILAPAILNNPELLSQLINALVNTVATISGLPATPGAQAAGQTFQTTMADVINNLKGKFPSGNVSAGAMLGIGYVGNGLGVGFFASVDAGVYTPEGKSILAATGRVNNTFTLLGGAGFNIWDGFSVGIALRPTILGYVNILPSQILTQVLPAMSGGEFPNLMPLLLSDGIYKGFNVGVDVGALLDLGPFTLGLAIKDLIPFQISYEHYTGNNAFEQYIGNLVNFKSAQNIESSYQVPWGKINVGLMFHPDLGAFTKLVDLKAEIDLTDIIGGIRQLTDSSDLKNTLSSYNFWRQINVGAEVGLFNFIALRGGFTEGSWTGGFGIKLFILDINAAFSAKYGDHPANLGDFSEIGFSIELALLRIHSDS